jgi:hypothetical protein
MLQYEVSSKKQLCDVFIEPQRCSAYSMLDLSKAEEIAYIGYQAAIAMKDELLKLK